MGLTFLNAVLPGTGFLAAGRRRLGAVTLGIFLALVAGAAWLATGGRRAAARTAVDTDSLLLVVGGLGVLALLWALVVVAGYWMLVPRHLSRGRHAFGSFVVALLLLAVLAPSFYAARLTLVHRDLIAGVFEDGESATVVDVPDPFGDKERVNVLLLGGDAGWNREGTRTDTVIVASIDTETGDTTLISLPRNLQNLPFPEDTQMAEIFPDGFWLGNESESLLNSVYRNGPEQYPDALGAASDNPGADWLKLGVGEALGLTIDYYMLVNLDGFSQLVDALGGITVNVNYWVPIGGDTSAGILPGDYIAPGPNQELDGRLALNFARGRYGLTDYDRMARQRCTIDAIVDAADPITLLRRYQELAETTKDIVLTDIPSSALDDFVDLAFLVKDADIRSLVLDTSVIDPAYPDYDRIRDIVDRSLNPPAPSGGNGGGDSTGSPTTSAAPSDPATDPTPDGDENPVENVRDACAYDPEQAQEALDAGMPPTS